MALQQDVILKAKRRDPEALKQVFEEANKVLDQYLSTWNYNISKEAISSLSKPLVIKAIETYDPSKGTAFNSHLYNNFKKLSRDIMYYSDTVRMPENQRLKVGKLMAAMEELKDNLGRDPSAQELAEHLGWSLKETNRILNNVTYDMPDQDLVPKIYSTLDNHELIINQIYNDLPPREQVVMEHTLGLYGKPVLPAKEIAKKLKISEPMVTVIKKNIANKIQDALQRSGEL